MIPKMNKVLAVAIERCPAIAPKTLEQFLGGLLDEEPRQLARLPGTPATVLAAQFTCYAKSSADIAEVMRRQDSAVQQLTNAIWRIKPLEEKPAKKTLRIVEVTHDPGSSADKQCRACAACA